MDDGSFTGQRPMCSFRCTYGDGTVVACDISTVDWGLERCESDSVVGQLFARRGVYGLLFGDGVVRGTVEGRDMAGRSIEPVWAGIGAAGLRGVSESGIGVEETVGRRVGLPVSDGGVFDVVGAEGKLGEGSEGCRRGAGGISVDGVNSVSGERGGISNGGICTSVASGEVASVGVTGESGRSVPGAFGRSVSGAPGVVYIGPNVDRNRANRAAQRERRAKRKQMGVDWRVKDKPKTGSGRGYFSDLSSDVQRELKESRAAMLIAQNKETVSKVRARMVSEDLKTSEARCLESVANTARLAKKCAAMAKGTVVDSWCKTIASNVSIGAISRASSASSHDSGVSIPTYEEIKEMAMEGGADANVTARQLAYDLAKLELKTRYDNFEFFSEQDYLAEVFALKQEFSDVAYESSELLKFNTVDAVIKIFEDNGKPVSAKVCEDLVHAGLMQAEELDGLIY